MIIHTKKNGFTLVEMIVAMSIGLAIMLAIYSSMNLAQKSSASVGRKVATQQDARAVLDIMTMEIRMASYNPSGSQTIWTDSSHTASCTSIVWPTLVKENKGIQVANSDRIVIGMDLTDPPVAPTLIGDSASEYIEYTYFGGTTGTIFRNIGGTAGCSGDQTILGGAGSQTTVNNDESAVTGTCNNPRYMFQYFDKTGTNLGNYGSNCNVPSASIPEIRRIRITIVADTENPDSLTNEAKRMTYTTDLLVKNHVLCP